MELSRRSFIASAGAAGALAAAGAATALADEAVSSTADQASNQPWMPEKWDYETDVVVVGSGSIISAALRAYDNGLDVLVLEKHPTFFGGTTALSGGGCSCPNSVGSLEQGAPEIPRNILKDYLTDVAEGQSSDELIDMMLDNYAPAIDYLNKECGYQWKSFGVFPSHAYNFYYPFPELEDTYSDIPCHVSIGTHEATGAMPGRALPEFAKDALTARNIEVLMGTPATKLIYAGDPALGDGEVIGLWATDPDGNEIAIKARYAVVLGTGGFDHNRDMVRHYINHPIYATCAIDTNTGDGYTMAAELDANMRNMNKAFYFCYNMYDNLDNYSAYNVSFEDTESSGPLPSMIHPGMAGNIVVNRQGQRFMCEGGSYDLIGRAFDAYDTSRREWTNIPGYIITDIASSGQLGKGIGSIADMVESGELPEWVHVFDTMEELADGMGIDKENLLATVERWNAMCEEGVDKDFKRGEGTWDRFTSGNAARVESGELKNPCMAPLEEGPFYCFEIYPGMMQTSGGIEINANAQVKNAHGKVIPRLYAGSNCIASVFGRGYPLGGSTIANGFVVGYVAANHIATLQPWE